jgi:hypothetical protein
VRPGHHLDRLGPGGVAGDGAQLVGVGADHVGQHVRISRVALGTRHRQTFPIPRRLQRVHREHPVSGGDQRPHPRAPIRLDPDHHLISHVFDVITELPADHRVQPGDPRHTFRQAGLGQTAARDVHQLDVVVVG